MFSFPGSLTCLLACAALSQSRLLETRLLIGCDCPSWITFFATYKPQALPAVFVSLINYSFLELFI